MRNDPLDTLFVRGDEVNRELLSSILTRYVRLDEKGRIFPLSQFYSETNKNRVIIALLSRKAISLKTGTEESISPSELGKLIDLPDGSLRPTLRELVDEKLADDENSRYKISSHAVRRCSEILEKKKTSEEAKTMKTFSSKIKMKDAILDVVRQGGLDEPKAAKEIYQMVIQRRPGTIYNAMYKVLIDMIKEKTITREEKNGAWVYKGAKT
ncbi:MAG: hypothetical protein V1911_00760 [Candidatus Micrarchaeota archaeon]